MQSSFIFDESSSKYENDEFNVLFIKAESRYIEDMYKIKGYVYLNTIYESFGLMWDPYKTNTC